MKTPVGHLRLAPKIPKAGTVVGRSQTHPRGRAEIDAQPRRFLSLAARQSGIGDPTSCEIILSLLSASRAIRRALGGEIGFRYDSQARFSILITLYALSPLPSVAADLACDAEISRSSIGDVIKTLERGGLITSVDGGLDGDARIHLTDLGNRVAAAAVQRFLQVASSLCGGVGTRKGSAVVEVCGLIERQATSPSD